MWLRCNDSSGSDPCSSERVLALSPRWTNVCYPKRIGEIKMKRMLIIVAVSCLTITNAFAGKHGKQDGKAAQQAPAQQAVQQSGKLVGGYEAWREPQNLTVGVMKVA